MGMATYYLKARFASPRAAQAALPKFIALTNEGADAERWWRANNKRQLDKKFWPDFQQRFPLVFDCLGKVRADPQAVSYALNFGEPGDPTPTVEGKMLFFSAYVWHFASWSVLAKFLKTNLGALGTDWISEECVDPFGLLDP